MNVKPPSHPAAGGLNVSGPAALIAERLPTDKPPRDSIIYPKTGAPPFSLDPDSKRSGFFELTQYPAVVGSSVVAFKFREGVIMATDMTASYGSTLRYKSLQKIHKVNDNCMIGVSGEVSDYQHIQEILEEMSMDDFCADDGIELTPSEIYSILCRVLYNRRTKMDPLWNSVVVCGMQKGVPFLGSVGMLGTHYVDDHVTTGMGHDIMKPILRANHRSDMTREEAMKMMEVCLTANCYRDSKTLNKFQIAFSTSQGVVINDPVAMDLKWDLKHFENPIRNIPNAW